MDVVEQSDQQSCVRQVDHLGRRPLLVWGSAGVFVSLLLLSTSFAISEAVLTSIAACTLVATYALSFGPVTWLVTAELVPSGVRGKALGIGQVTFIHACPGTQSTPPARPMHKLLGVAAAPVASICSLELNTGSKERFVRSLYWHDSGRGLHSGCGSVSAVQKLASTRYVLV